MCLWIAMSRQCRNDALNWLVNIAAIALIKLKERNIFTKIKQSTLVTQECIHWCRQLSADRLREAGKNEALNSSALLTSLSDKPQTNRLWSRSSRIGNSTERGWRRSWILNNIHHSFKHWSNEDWRSTSVKQVTSISEMQFSITTNSVVCVKCHWHRPGQITCDRLYTLTVIMQRGKRCDNLLTLYLTV